ncbi:SulP family inorganic anion transporter [Saccharothrix violaceirubra]|uniref:SulP family inorganic anion transporter n=1 Tax=Saccharothrix violaceirubra TaxID=413306 RepID=UPI0016172D9E|nr:SulP family inorganic anion transporter [Saccharothrix violaceirubra]
MASKSDRTRHSGQAVPETADIGRAAPKTDIKAGFLVALIALPLCLGIAVASGFPPIAGVLTAIVGGILGGLLGGAPLTIKGPAAGLIVIAVGSVHDLGQGDLVAGYRRALAVGVVAALLQIVFGLVRAAGIGVAMSPSVVHGMLAAIGVIIIAKQAHVVLGVKPQAQSNFGLIAEIPHSLATANPLILLIGVLSLLILFGLPMVRARWSKVVPAPLIVLAVAIPVGLLLHVDRPHDYELLGAHHLGPEYLVRLPGSLLDAITFPDFSQILSGTSIQYIVMFALIGTIESTLTVLAVDSMDPSKRPSNLNRDLLAIGAGNLTSSLIGGLPMISEIVRSKANLDSGAKSRWSNVTHGIVLLLFVALIPGIVQTIPLAALGAMLVYTGFRLASPHEFRHVTKIGLDQLALFLTTLIVTLATDLLVGVASGLALKIVLHLVRGVPLPAFVRPRPQVTRVGSVLRVRIPGAAVFPALLPLRRAIAKAGDDVTEVIVDVRDAAVVDHTFLSRLEELGKELPNATLTVEGLDDLVASSAHPQATRRRAR